MDMLSNTKWHHPKKQSKIQRFSLQFLKNMFQKDEISKFSALSSPLTRDLSGLGFVILQIKHVFTACCSRFSTFPRNVQVSWSLLELCGRRVVKLQVKVLQVAHIQ